jgi:hypothetical protein
VTPARLHFSIGLVKAAATQADGLGQSEVTLYVIRGKNEAEFAVGGPKRIDENASKWLSMWMLRVF